MLPLNVLHTFRERHLRTAQTGARSVEHARSKHVRDSSSRVYVQPGVFDAIRTTQRWQTQTPPNTMRQNVQLGHTDDASSPTPFLPTRSLCPLYQRVTKRPHELHSAPPATRCTTPPPPTCHARRIYISMACVSSRGSSTPSSFSSSSATKPS